MLSYVVAAPILQKGRRHHSQRCTLSLILRHRSMSPTTTTTGAAPSSSWLLLLTVAAGSSLVTAFVTRQFLRPSPSSLSSFSSSASSSSSSSPSSSSSSSSSASFSSVSHSRRSIKQPTVHAENLLQKKTNKKKPADEPPILAVSPANIGNFAQGGLSLLLHDLAASPLCAADQEYVRCLLYARGAAKAFLIRHELINYKKYIQHTQKEMECWEKELRQVMSVCHYQHYQQQKQRRMKPTQQQTGSDPRSTTATSTITATTATPTTTTPTNTTPTNTNAVSPKAEEKEKEKQEKEKEELPWSLRMMDQQLCLIRGYLAVLRHTRTWTKAICCVPRYPTPQTEPLFVAGDECVWRIPPRMDLTHICDALKVFIDAQKGVVRELIATNGWPLPACEHQPSSPNSISLASTAATAEEDEEGEWMEAEDDEGKRPAGGGKNKHHNTNNNIKKDNNNNKNRHKHVCTRCSNSFGKVWMRAGLCFKCADDYRQQGRCPWETGHPKLLCPHSQRCFQCEGATCWPLILDPQSSADTTTATTSDTTTMTPRTIATPTALPRTLSCPAQQHCRIARGNGQDALTLIQTVRPSLIFMDFDQTLCSTRSGGPPVAGRHCLNSALVSVFTRRRQQANNAMAAASSSSNNQKKNNDQLWPRIVIVTKQNHSRTTLLRAFLAGAGVHPDEIYCLGGRQVAHDRHRQGGHSQRRRHHRSDHHQQHLPHSSTFTTSTTASTTTSTTTTTTATATATTDVLNATSDAAILLTKADVIFHEWRQLLSARIDNQQQQKPFSPPSTPATLATPASIATTATVVPSSLPLPTMVFVDDTARELLDPRLRTLSNLYCLVFVEKEFTVPTTNETTITPVPAMDDCCFD